MGVGSRITYWTIAAFLGLVHITWFCFEIGISTINNYNLVDNNGNNNFTNDPSNDAVNITNYEYIWRSIFVVACLAATWFSERYPLSRAAALSSFVITTILTFSWLSVNLFYTYSIYSLTSTGYHTEFCQADVSAALCQLTFGVGVLSIMHIIGIFTLWLLSIYQITRSEQNPTPTVSEKLLRYMLYLGLCGCVIWSLSCIVLNSDYNNQYFSSYSISQNYKQGYQWLIISAAYGSAAWISYGATRGAKWVAVLCNTLLFLELLPSFIFDGKRALQCPPNNTPVNSINWHCVTSEAMAAGEGIVACTACIIMFVTVVQYFTNNEAELYQRTKLQQSEEQNYMNTNPQELSTTQQQPYTQV